MENYIIFTKYSLEIKKFVFVFLKFSEWNIFCSLLLYLS